MRVCARSHESDSAIDQNAKMPVKPPPSRKWVPSDTHSLTAAVSITCLLFPSKTKSGSLWAYSSCVFWPLYEQQQDNFQTCIPHEWKGDTQEFYSHCIMNMHVWDTKELSPFLVHKNTNLACYGIFAIPRDTDRSFTTLSSIQPFVTGVTQAVAGLVVLMWPFLLLIALRGRARSEVTGSS